MNMQFTLLLFVFLSSSAVAQNTFQVIPLGVKGGSDESNLSSYAIAVNNTEEYVCLDAGTINYGVQRAIEKKIWKGLPEEIIRNKIKGYLISHPHLDHISGLITNSPDDSPKAIYGLPYTLDVIQDKYFSWKSWANFGNEGEKPALGKYHYVTMEQGKEIQLENTSMTVKAFPLSHSNTSQSTAFLVGYKGNYLLYLGDTGADSIEKSNKLNALWREVAALISDKKLKGIFIEVSFSNEQPDHLLFGHLTPKLLMDELNQLSELTGKDALKKFQIVITHLKPAGMREKAIRDQLKKLNQLDVNLIFAEQANILKF
jgi:cAMP phosphodiesterase